MGGNNIPVGNKWGPSAQPPGKKPTKNNYISPYSIKAMQQKPN